MKILKLEINQDMVYAFEKPRKFKKKQALLPGSIIFHHFMFVIDVAMCQVPSDVATHSRLLIQNKNYLLFKDHLNDDFPKVGVLHNVMKMQTLPYRHLALPTSVLRSASHTMYVSVTKSEDTGFVCAQMGVRGYGYGVRASLHL